MTEGDSGTSFVGQEMKNVFVTLDVAAALTNYSPAYIERLCRDGYIPCAGGRERDIYPAIGELVKLLNITLSPTASINFVSPEDILTPSLSREQLLERSAITSNGVVGNQPVGISVGGVSEPAPLKRGALSFSLVSDDEESPLSSATVSAAPLAPPKAVAVEIEVPPPPVAKSLPQHWPVKTSTDASAHFDDAPLMPPLATKLTSVTPKEVAMPSPIAIAPQAEILPAEAVPDLPLVAPHEELMTPPAQALLTEIPDALLIQPEEHLAKPLPQELLIREEREVEREPEQHLAPRSALAVAPLDAPEIMLTPEQNLVQSAAQTIDVGSLELSHDTDEHPAVIVQEEGVHQDDVPLSVIEAHEPEAISVPTDTLVEEAAASIATVPTSVEKTEPPVVIIDPTPPVGAGVVERILDEATRSKVTPVAQEESIEVVSAEQVPAEPIVAIPHYAVAQLTPSMHPLALPPRVVPFATMVPAAYPQVAAVFTQPHARASEWLPWMRTSHFSRSEVRTATNPEVHPSYPRYSKSPARVAEISDKDMSREVQVASPDAQIVPPPAKVFVSVVGKPPLPTQVPVVAHVAPLSVDAPPTPSVREVPKIEDAWDEMLASQATRDNTVTPAFEEIPQKSRDDLLKEVSADIKDSWDASFLAGLGAA